MRTIIEPFRIKTTEAIKMTTKEQRGAYLEEASYNVFLLRAEDCLIDLLTDSGTGALSAKQWAAMMDADESYAGSRSWFHFQSVIENITGMKHIFPTHQGRAAEHLLMQTRVRSNDVIPNNSHFDTTRANIEFVGGEAKDLLAAVGYDLAATAPFKGDIDLAALKELLDKTPREKIPFCMITVTNNTGGGQPVSMANIRDLKKLLSSYAIPLVIDACRFAENAYFIKTRETGYQDKSLLEIAQEMFSYADAATMSCKKDGLSHIGGFFVCQNDAWAEDFKNALILKEGFPTYGGLTGRDLESIAVGLMEALDYEYQHYRHATVRYLGERLDTMNVPYVKPPGGHALFLDARSLLPHVPPTQFPGVSLVNALYIEGGIRGVEIGTLMFGKKDAAGIDLPAPLDLVRLAFPRRSYTQSHFDFMLEVIEEVVSRKAELGGYKITKEPPFLRHFSSHLQPL
jgi:tryptophanase